METTVITTKNTTSRRAAVNGLAIIGFIVLIILGMALAVYAASFVPKAVSKIGGAAVYLSSVFTGDTDAPSTLEVVTPGTTVPFGDATSTLVVVGSDATTTVTTTTSVPQAPVAGTPVITRVEVGTTPAQLYGLPDLAVENVTTGYLTSSNTNTFRSSNRVPDGERGAVKFTVVNRGTNASGRFDFEAELPTSRSFTYNSSAQRSLLPGERIDYILGFDQARSGDDREITITVDPDRDISESSESNNDRSVTVDIEN